MKSIHLKPLLVAFAGVVSVPLILMSTAQAQPTYPGYGPGMWQQLTPEQRQQMWEYMQQQGYGPGMMMGPGMMGGYGPGMMGGYGGGYGYGMGPRMMGGYGMGPGMWQPMTPEQYKQWWDQTHAAAPEKK